MAAAFRPRPDRTAHRRVRRFLDGKKSARQRRQQEGEEWLPGGRLAQFVPEAFQQFDPIVGQHSTALSVVGTDTLDKIVEVRPFSG